MTLSKTKLRELLPKMIPIKGGRVANFELAQFPVTQMLWEAVMGENPSYFVGSTRPVESVTCDQVMVFLDKLNDKLGERFRLPGEVEWEYAARGGIHQNNFFYAGSNSLNEVGWYRGNSYGETKPVGLKFPNALGLYDMSGNVWEWCQNRWHNTSNGVKNDGNEETGFHTIRGGSYECQTLSCEVMYYNIYRQTASSIDLGFRLSRTL